MASNAPRRGHSALLSQQTRLEALRSRLKGATPDLTRRRDALRVSEPIQDDNFRQVRGDWDSSDKAGNQWRHREFGHGSDHASDGMEANSLDVSSLVEELKERIEALESSMDGQERWNKEVTQAVDRLYALQKATGTAAGKETAR